MFTVAMVLVLAQSAVTPAAPKTASTPTEREAIIRAIPVADREKGLLGAYMSFQILQHCVMVRNGYALKYINDEELKTAKDAMSKFEALVGAGIDKDKVWKDATAYNHDISKINPQIAAPMMLRYGTTDFFEAISHADYAKAKEECRSFKTALDNLITATLGGVEYAKPF